MFSHLHALNVPLHTYPRFLKNICFLQSSSSVNHYLKRECLYRIFLSLSSVRSNPKKADAHDCTPVASKAIHILHKKYDSCKDNFLPWIPESQSVRLFLPSCLPASAVPFPMFFPIQSADDCLLHSTWLFAAILHLVSFPIYKSFLHKNITLVNFIFHNAENGTRCPLCPLNGLNISRIQYSCNVRAVHALNYQIVNFPDNGRFWFFCPYSPFSSFFISIRSFQISYDFAILNAV